MCTHLLLAAILQRTASCTHVTGRIHSRWFYLDIYLIYPWNRPDGHLAWWPPCTYHLSVEVFPLLSSSGITAARSPFDLSARNSLPTPIVVCSTQSWYGGTNQTQKLNEKYRGRWYTPSYMIIMALGWVKIKSGVPYLRTPHTKIKWEKKTSISTPSPRKGTIS